MMQQLHNRRSAAILCLMAFVMMIAISTFHTHVCGDSHMLSTNVLAIEALGQPVANDCIACEILLYGSGNVIIVAACLFIFCTCAVLMLKSITSVIYSTIVSSGSPRAPPII
jgi:hypothetical protein